MAVPAPEVCDQHLAGIVSVIAACAFGVLAESAGVLALKGYDYWLSIRERRLRILHELRRSHGS